MILTICNPTYTLPQLIFNESTLGQVARASILQQCAPSAGHWADSKTLGVSQSPKVPCKVDLKGYSAIQHSKNVLKEVVFGISDSMKNI